MIITGILYGSGISVRNQMKKWTVVIILALAQFIMVLDSTVMNVSLSDVVEDLNTSVAGLQSAITFYTLTMAAFMLTGGKLGDRLGRLRAFRIGSIVYGIGSCITAFSPNLAVLLIGWSLIEGLGAVLVIPAITSLIAENYVKRDRVIAYAIIGMSSGIAAAAGPLIGGFFTTYLSWRYVFVGETLIIVFLLIASRAMSQAKIQITERLDLWSVVLSATALSSLVFGILQSKTWGWIVPNAIPVIRGIEVAPFGISLVAYLILAGLILLWVFYQRQLSLEKHNKTPLLRVSLLSIKPMRAGLFSLLSQYLITAALFFVLPVYLQMVLGLDALETGVKIIPLSIALILFSILGSKLVNSFSPKRITRLGQIALALGSFLLLISVDPEMKNLAYTSGMFLAGAGLGLLASQLGNIIVSSVDEEAASEAGGLQGTSQNLGSSLGTALVGSILIASLTSGFVAGIGESQGIPDDIKEYINTNSKTGVEVVSSEQVEDYAISKEIPANEASQIAHVYETSQVKSLKISLFFVVLFSLFSFIFSHNLPGKI
jgi:MFS family permease